jgi:hypothetical protein
MFKFSVVTHDDASQIVSIFPHKFEEFYQDIMPGLHALGNMMCNESTGDKLLRGFYPKS